MGLEVTSFSFSRSCYVYFRTVLGFKSGVNVEKKRWGEKTVNEKKRKNDEKK